MAAALVSGMRNFLLAVLVAGASACAAHASHPTTLPVQYSCGDADIIRDHGELHVGASGAAIERRGWHDDEGDHFVTWPVAPTDVVAVEYVVPSDPRADAVRRTYNTSTGTSTADWLLTSRQVCTAHGGYNDALARFMKGATLDQLVSEFSLQNRDEARGLVRNALMTLQKRYWRDN